MARVLLFRVASPMRYAYLRDCRGGLLLRCRSRTRVRRLSRIDLDGPVFSWIVRQHIALVAHPPRREIAAIAVHRARTPRCADLARRRAGL